LQKRHTRRTPVRPTKQVFIGVSVKGRMIGRQPAWLIRREGHVEMTRLRSIPLCAKKPAKNKKIFCCESTQVAAHRSQEARL